MGRFLFLPFLVTNRQVILLVRFFGIYLDIQELTIVKT